MSPSSAPAITVVGIGADGWCGLGARARAAVDSAEVVLGGKRHLALLPPVSAELVAWPSPLLEALPALLEQYDGRRLVVLASGDPLLSGIGTTLVSMVGTERVEILPTVSSVALARARMGWSAESVDVVTLVGRDPEVVRRHLSPGRRLVVLSRGGETPEVLGALLSRAGFGASPVTVLSDLGGDDEQRRVLPASAWTGHRAPALNVVCVECRLDDDRTGWLPAVPGLPDTAFEHDGQLTRRDLRSSALSRLAPAPGHLLWDVGAGAGSVGIEWLRSDPRCRAVAVEADAQRVERIGRNAAALGVPALQVHHARAPEALSSLPTPDAVFVGGGASREGVLDTCWERLAPGGRLVVHAVTLQTEQLVLTRYHRHGGELTRLGAEYAEPLGTFTGWAPARAVVQWAVTKPGTGNPDREDER